MKRIMILTAILLMGFMAACGGGAVTPVTSSSTSTSLMPGTPVSADGGTYWSITPLQLASFTVKDFVLADTDTSYIGEISGTDLFLNSDKISQELDKLPTDKNSKIVVYCTAGVHSKAVAETLVKAGYTRVMDLDGGITAWKKAGYQTMFNNRTMV
jgi:rhodanese-related sulfurtransferase